jgi:hypothetical protein
MLMLLSMLVILFCGVRLQVLRKKRTSLANAVHVEDSEFRNGTRFRVIAGAETTGGEYFVMEALVRPGAYGVWRAAGAGGGGSGGDGASASLRPGSEPPHSHAFQTEVVIVKSGMLGFWKGPRGGVEDDAEEQQSQTQQQARRRSRAAGAPGRGRAGVAGPGDAIVFAAGEPHSWWNAGVTNPDADVVKPKDAQADDSKRKSKTKKNNKADAPAAPPPAEPAASTAEPGELLVQVVTWPAGPAGERLYENLAGLGRDYGSPLAVGPAQRALTYSRAAARLETLTADGWASMEAWALPLLETLGYKGTYPKYRSDVSRAADLDAAAQAYAEARSAEATGGADAAGGGGGASSGDGEDNKVRGSAARAELIAAAASAQGKEARRAKLQEIAARRRKEQVAAQQKQQQQGEGGQDGGAAVPAHRRQWHVGEEAEAEGQGGAAASKKGSADDEERREAERQRREEAQARRRRRDDEEEEEEGGKDEL